MRRKASKVKHDCTCVHVYIICLCGRPILLLSDTSNSGTPEVSEIKCNGDGRLDVTIRIEVCTVCSIQSLVGNQAKKSCMKPVVCSTDSILYLLYM